MNDKGRQVIIHYSREDLTGRLICYEIPQEEIVASVNDLRTAFIILLLVLILVPCPIGYFVANRILSPIKAIAEYSKQVAVGNLRQKELSDSSQDEVSELAASFAVMVTNLRE
ncbi:MAG: methyl-accepting chemotaxis sensory transducer with Cache sensor [Firmicutes bacterium]|nr:methyl-accepting chemotaxis sensory transducer with Cache sensor [Bacillota bacterium]